MRFPAFWHHRKGLRVEGRGAVMVPRFAFQPARLSIRPTPYPAITPPAVSTTMRISVNDPSGRRLGRLLGSNGGRWGIASRHDMPHIAFNPDPRLWHFGTSVTHDAHGEYRWWIMGPLAICWG